MTAEIRRHQTTLVCSGLAVIAFGLWSIVRAFLVLFFNMASVRAAAASQMPAEGVELPLDTIITVTCIVIFVVLFLDLVIRSYVGFSAIAEGNGKKKRIHYIVYSILFLVFSLGGQLMLFISSAREELTVSVVISLLIEISSNIAFVEIIRSSLAIRRYARMTDRGDAHAA